MSVTKGATNPRCPMEDPMDVHDRNRDGAKLEYTVSTGYAIPAVSEIPQHRMSWIAWVESVGMSEDRPFDKPLPESLNK